LSSLVYRAFFALPASIRDPQGQPVNAVRGYLDMTSLLLRDRHPAAMVHVFDGDWRPPWRVAAYPGYKADRRPEPPELTPQFALIREVLDAAGMQVAEGESHEAEDVIGTLATGASRDHPVEVVTGDRDLLQLVRDPEVAVLFTVKGVKDLRRFDAAEVRERYGVPPERYAELAMLRGDPSDGLPGVPGVGEKTAAALLTQHGSLDALMATTHGLPPRLAAALRAAAGYLEAMRRVVPVATDAPHRLSPLGVPDEPRLDELARHHRIDGPVERLRAALADAALAEMPLSADSAAP